MPAKAYEGGVRPIRLEFVRESTFDTHETDPAWVLYSDAVQEFDPGIDPGTEGQRSLGDKDFVDHFTSTMSATPSITYDLQQKTSDGDTLLTSGGDSNDALTDALQLTNDNRLAESHQIVRRMEQDDLDAGNTVSGSTARNTRQYLVYTGALIGDATLSIDPGSPQPIRVTLDYVCRKAEPHQFDQPTSSEEPIELWVTSTDGNDTTQTVTVQGTDTNDANQEEDISLNGTTDVQSTNTYKTIDAIQLDAETAGDVEVYVDDGSGTTAGDQIATLYGQDTHDHGEGDLGVPALGSGSHASAIGQSYETPQGATLQKPGGTDLADEVMATELNVANNVSEDGTTTGPRPVIISNERTPQADVTVTGETEYFNLVQDALQTTTEAFQIDLVGGETIQLDSAAVLEAGGAEDVGQGLKEVEATVEGQGVTISS